MSKFTKLAILGGALLCFSASYASNNPSTFLGPTLKGRYTSTFNNNTAYSVLGELGVKNLRAGGTLGWKLQENQYIKVSGEYLMQDITYSFLSGHSDQWVQQGALGAGYLYEFNGYSYDPHFNLNAYVSHAPSKTLGNVAGTGVINGTLQNFILKRHIAGSNGAGIMPAVSVAPWQGARVGLGVNYDNVRYNNNYPPNHDAKGLGGTITYDQVLTHDVNLNVGAEVRKPFNNYAAGVSFANVPYFGNWVLGVDGEYTSGKNALPNTWNASVSGSYALDQRSQQAPVYKDRAFKDYKDMTPASDDLVNFTSDPAVYMPQVLAVADQEDPVNCPFGEPTFTGTIANQSGSPGVTQTFNSPTQFGGSGITYSVSSTQTGSGSSTVSINSSTGVVTVTGLRSTTSITITATNACNRTVSSNTFTATFT